VLSGPTRCYELLEERSGRPGIRIGIQHGELGFRRRVAVRSIRSDQADVARALIAGDGTARHANVVPTIDVLVDGNLVHIILEHIDGPTVADLVDGLAGAGRWLPARIACAIIHDALLGVAHLHATQDEALRTSMVHAARSEVIPTQMIVGIDGMTRILETGVPIPRRPGEDLPYLAPERPEGSLATSEANVYAFGVLLWELLTGARMPPGMTDGAIDRPSARVPGIPKELDAVVMCALSFDPRRRFATPAEMAYALHAAVVLATRAEVADVLQALRAGAPIPDDPPPRRLPSQPTRSFAPRVLLVFAALLVVALAVVVGRQQAKKPVASEAPPPPASAPAAPEASASAAASASPLASADPGKSRPGDRRADKDLKAVPPRQHH
jgi:serine/threonine-protein kinase